MPTKPFLAAGDLINPVLVAHATVEDDAEGPRLDFAAGAGTPGRVEVQLTGEKSGAYPRFLGINDQSLTSSGAFGAHGRPIEVPETRPFGGPVGSPAGRLGPPSGLRSSR